LSGHGNYYEHNGTMRVPEGTSFTVYAEHGSPITGALGNLIESGGDTSRVFSRTFYAGDEIPNYMLEPSSDLDIIGTPHTVDTPTLLEYLLKPNMGQVDFAACLGDWSTKVFDVGGIYDNTTYEFIEKYKSLVIDADDDDGW
jgi:hypothetical protein